MCRVYFVVEGLSLRCDFSSEETALRFAFHLLGLVDEMTVVSGLTIVLVTPIGLLDAEQPRV